MSAPRRPILVEICQVAAVVAVIATAAASCPVRADETAALARFSSGSELGYEKPGLGVAIWHDHCGKRICMRLEVLATTAEKAGSEAAYSGLAEQRFSIGPGWWVGPGYEFTNDHQGNSSRATLAAGWYDVDEFGSGHSVTVRLLGEDSTVYRSNGVSIRWTLLHRKALVSAEFSQIAYTADGLRSWGRRYTIMAGLRFRRKN